MADRNGGVWTKVEGIARRRMIQNVSRAVVEFRRLVRFGLTGVVATLTYAGVSFLLVEAGLTGAVTAAVVAYLASATVSYFGHLHFSFRVEPDHRKFLWRFAVTSAITFPMTIIVTYMITKVLGDSYRLAVAIVMILIPTTNYLCNRFWVFLPASTKNVSDMNAG